MLPSRAARAVVLASHALLLAALPALGGVLGALLALPLLLPLRGLWRGTPYTYAWCSLLLVFYTAAALAESWAQPARAGAALIVAAVAGIEFCALVAFVRLRAAEARRAA